MTAKLYSWNVNGLRASMDHGLMDFIESVKPDVLCMQETKIMGNSLPVELLSAGYKLYINEAEKRGYSGTVTLTKVEPLNVFYSYSIQLGVFIVSGAIVAMIPAHLASKHHPFLQLPLHRRLF